MLIINSKHPPNGDKIQVSIDGYQIGAFPVTDRPASISGVETAAARVHDAASQRQLEGLVHAGSFIRFVNGHAVYEAALDPLAALNFDECKHEATLLAPQK